MSGIAGTAKRAEAASERGTARRRNFSTGRSPARVDAGVSGHGVFATRKIAAGEIVTRYLGDCVNLDAVPSSEICYVLWKDDGRWLIPESPSRFINHSCDPNCETYDDPDDANASVVVAMRDIARGEEITISYDTVEFEDFERNRSDPMYVFWHPAWSFDCTCGAANCRGRIDGYRVTMPRK